MNKILIGSALIASMALTGAVQAAGPFAFAEMALAKGDFSEGTFSDDSGYGFAIGGGYMLNDMFGAEVGYVSFGEMVVTDGGETKVDGNGWLFGGRVLIPVSDAWNAFGRMGLTSWDIDAKGVMAGTADGSDLYYGLGASYAINEQISMTAGWTRYTMDAKDWDTEFTYDHWGIGLMMQY